MFANLLKPKPDLAALILRLGLAAIFIVHGYIKIDVRDALIPEMSLSTQKLVGWAEFISGWLLAVGLLSRIAVLILSALQVTAIIMISGRYALEGLRMQAKGADYLRVGPEYNLVLIAMCLGVLVLGSGLFSLDHLLLSRWRRQKAPSAAASAKAA